jgi:hypothetical protein
MTKRQRLYAEIAARHTPAGVRVVTLENGARTRVRQPGFVISYLQEALMLLWEVFAPPFG